MRATRAGAVLLAGVMAAGLAACGDESTDENAGSELGAAAAGQVPASDPGASEGSASEDQADQDTGADTGSSGDGDDSSSAGGPAPSPSTECVDPEGTPEIPSEAAPPTMAGDMEPGEIPNGLGGEMVPQFGELIVDVPPGGCLDYATQLQAGQRILVHTHADDGKVTDIRVFAPDGERIAEWQTGEQGVVEGWDFYNENPVPADGVYVFRVIHRDGSDDPFVISFYGQP